MKLFKFILIFSFLKKQNICVPHAFKFIAIISICFLYPTTLLATSLHFRSIRVNPYGGYTPILPIEETLAKDINHYAVDYDNQSRMVKIKYELNGKERTPSITQVPIIQISYEDNFINYNFLTYTNTPTADESGVYSVRIKVDENNFPISRFSYDKAKNLQPDGQGVSSYIQEFDKIQKLIRTYSYDRKGTRVPLFNDVMSITSKLDNTGNVVEKYYLNAENKLTTEPGGNSIYKYTYTNNLLVREDAYDKTGQLQKQGYSTIIQEFGEHNCIILRKHYNYKGEPQVDDTGIFAYVWHYDVEGNRTRQDNYDINEQLTLDNHDVATYTWTYFQQGNELEQYNLSPEGKPTLDSQGIASYRWKYDEYARVIEESFYGVNDEPLQNLWGVFRHQFLYDLHGNLLSQANIGTDYLPSFDSNKVSRYEWEYNYMNQKIKQKNYNVDNKLILDANSLAAYQWQYTKWGQPARVIGYGVYDQIKADKNGVSEYRWDYNSSGNIVQIRRYGIDSELIEDNTGIAITRWNYDSNGDLIKINYYDRLNQLKE